MTEPDEQQPAVASRLHIGNGQAVHPPWPGPTDLAAGTRRRDLLFAVMPVAAVLLLVSSIGFLLWLTARDAREVAETTLISDSLWVEQTLRFQLATDEDMVARLAFETGHDDMTAQRFLDRSQMFLANNPEVIAIAWLGPDGEPLAALPAGGRPPPSPVTGARPAALSARPVYGVLRLTPGGPLVDIAALPDGRDGGVRVIATVSLATLLARHVPWWIAGKYAVRLTDLSGAVLAEKAHVEPLDGATAHRIAFDPPISGTFLDIAPYVPPVARGPDFVTVSILGLSVLAMVSLVALYRHVGRRRRAEARLRTETAFRRAMEDSLTVGMRARDFAGRILYVNPAFCHMVDFPADALIGRLPPLPYWMPEHLGEITARHDALNRGAPEAQSFETRFRRQDGTPLDVLVIEAPLIDGDGVHRGWMGSIIDITERKAAAEVARRLAESVQRTARLVTLGEMASTLAHEINQPLAAIASYAAGCVNMLKAGRAEGGDIIEALGRLGAQARRAGEIIRRIQDFVRKREPQFAEVAMGQMVAELVAFVAADARTLGVQITYQIAPGLPAVRGDRILLEQLLLNLMRNGMEAMAAVLPDRRRLAIAGAVQDGQFVLSVADQGAGIDQAVAERLFDAFVSTKAEGMGMGLNICRSIMELHGGQLTHAPRPGGGTIFTVSLPAVVG